MSKKNTTRHIIEGIDPGRARVLLRKKEQEERKDSEREREKTSVRVCMCV